MQRKYKDKAERDHVLKRRWLHGNDKIIEEIYKRDHSRCSSCGIGEKEHKEKRKRSLIIHHIDCNPKNNTIDNQRLMCVLCHNKLHGVLKRVRFDAGIELTLHKEVFLRCAHNLRDDYPYNCKRVHGEYFRVRLWLKGRTLDKYGMLVDFKTIKKELKKRYDHRYLNEITPFNKINPTSENFARHLFVELNAKFVKLITKPKVIKIRVYESDTSYIEVGE